jgi:hypothetical protein
VSTEFRGHPNSIIDYKSTEPLLNRGGPSWRGKIRGVKGENKRGGAGRLSYMMHLRGQSRAIKLLYAPAPPPTTVWALKPSWWALHLLGLSLANILECTRKYAGMHT